ncbi:MAG: Stealth CR1 domain-containing protein [Polyangiaceae bacterium]|nr:Stealth CR1 domain-containing protein [Polyangiaceae bacterium]
MSKLRKFFASPGHFWRDFLLKLYPEDLDGSNPARPETHRFAAPVHAPADHQPPEAYPITFPIDVVYTWVDGQDPKWLARKNAALARSGAPAAAIGPARFACRGELRYSLRSLERYAPWVNHVYFVTDGQVPPWLDTTNDRVSIVDHTEIIERQYLPTFNSHVIEAHLHRIAGLAEHYLYFNDDVMLGRPTTPGHFFAANGNAHLFLTQAQTPSGPVTPHDNPTQVAAKNARELLYRRFGQQMRFKFAHAVHPQLRSVNERIAAEFAREIAASCSNRFRGRTDLAFATYLAPNYTYLTGRADLRTIHYAYFNVRSPLAIRFYRALLARRGTERAPHSICLNDIDVTGACIESLLQQEVVFLERYFPGSSCFERTDGMEVQSEVLSYGAGAYGPESPSRTSC